MDHVFLLKQSKKEKQFAQQKDPFDKDKDFMEDDEALSDESFDGITEDPNLNPDFESFNENDFSPEEEDEEDVEMVFDDPFDNLEDLDVEDEE